MENVRKILSLLLKIKEITKNKMLIQTRKPDQKIFNYVSKGNLVDFYKDEIKRKNSDTRRLVYL